MNKLVLDPTLGSQLNAVNGEVELCDQTGRTLGYFLPAQMRNRILYDWAKAQFTDEELDRAEQQTGGMTTAQMLEWLNTL
jgi:hypothetical protein